MTETSIWLRPEHAPVGRPAERSRAEITAAAIAVADAGGLAAVSMRRVAAELGTGAASLYRYVATRDDLLDLMADAVVAEYELAPPTGDALADLVAVGVQGRRIMRGHPWLPELVITRGTLGPRGADLLEHVLTVLAGHPASAVAKLEAFGLLNGFVALYAHNELHAGSGAVRRQAAFLAHVAAEGGHPRLAEVVAGSAGARDGDRFERLLRGVLAGVLGHPSPA